MNTKTKIIFLIPSLDAGGIETYTLRFLKYAKGNFEPYIIVRSQHKGDLYEDYLKETKNILFFPLGYFNLRNLFKYYKLFCLIKPKTVVDFNANFAGLPMFIAKRAEIVKRIAFYRQGKNHYGSGFFKNIYNNCVNKLVFHYATDILSNSHAALEYFFSYRNCTDTRFEVISNGINVKDYNFEETQEAIQKDLNIPLGNFVIGHVGRFDPAKNHQTILDVASLLLSREKKVHFVFCGLGTEKIHSIAKELQIEKHITVLGFRRDIPRVLKALDLFFFPSITEGQPNALIEAMVSDIPVLASNIPAIQECVPVVLHSNLYEPNDVDAFEKAVGRLLDEKGFDKIDIKEEIKTKFDATTNFKLFLNKIV
jgi:glycosyltransferase involved in cell wall biosynthesis